MTTVSTQGGFMDGINGFVTGATDTVLTLFDGYLNYAQRQAELDAIGAGQQQVVNAPTVDTQANAAPVSPEQYNQAAKQAKNSPSVNLDTNTLLMIGGGLIALFLVARA